MEKVCSICGNLVNDGSPIGNNDNYWIGISCGCDDYFLGKAYQELVTFINSDRPKEEKEKYLKFLSEGLKYAKEAKGNDEICD